ncbi:hypothetical protein XELAEV_18011158mg [Xenopus laevis]|uniref:Uncharacterized protein n=1 Tax=Xenopus laevis TaxID=8355 RepID=A0A974I2N1_XENLA|nr:hypothetical protein XELAEV_18011158mg [Xenopus laevis]
MPKTVPSVSHPLQRRQSDVRTDPGYEEFHILGKTVMPTNLLGRGLLNCPNTYPHPMYYTHIHYALCRC